MYLSNVLFIISCIIFYRNMQHIDKNMLKQYLNNNNNTYRLINWNIKRKIIIIIVIIINNQ